MRGRPQFRHRAEARGRRRRPKSASTAMPTRNSRATLTMLDPVARPERAFRDLVAHCPGELPADPLEQRLLLAIGDQTHLVAVERLEAWDQMRDAVGEPHANRLFAHPDLAGKEVGRGREPAAS